MTADWKALCAELLAALKSWSPSGGGPLEGKEAETEARLIDRARAALSEPKLEEAPVWTEGICGDGAALLRDFVMVPIEEVVQELNEGAQARAVLARWGRSAPQPVPVSERLPGPDDCDAGGMCWWWCSPAERWLRCGIPQPDQASRVHTHWLPAHALPLPGQP